MERTMRRSYLSAYILAVLCACTVCAALPDGPPSPVDGPPLPRYMTPAERLLPLPQPAGERAAPLGCVRCPAEYEPASGLFIAWEGYYDVLTAIAAGATADPAVTVYCVVDTASEQTSATSTLSAGGVNMSRVQFIVRTTDTVWIRDYGPRFIFENGQRAIIDHTYNRPRPNDNAFNDYVATLWSTPQYDIPLTHGGGNFHLFSNGEAFMTSLIQTENSSLTAQQIKDYYRAYQNLDVTIYPGFPTSFDSTQHIDMWMLPLADHKVIIGQYASSTGTPYTITENAAADLTARGYTVYRTPGWNSGGTHYTYTNGVILNNRAIISKFNVTQDAQALATFQQALPGYTIQQVDCSSIITAAGAMHCIVMHVPALPVSPYIQLKSPLGGETLSVGQTYNITWCAGDGVGVTGVDILCSLDNGATWPQTLATGEANDGVFAWTVPSWPTTQARIKVIAYDADGHAATDMSDAGFTIARSPIRILSFPLDTNPGWTTEGAWAFGVPQGYGSHLHDPTSGHTGTNVYGFNLAGDYTNNIATPQYLTTTAINCALLSHVELRFWRWLGSESFDDATIDVSNNGVSWTNVWNNSALISEGAWTQQTYSLSAVADGQPTVYVRWGEGPTDAGVTYPGWNIDDVEIWAFEPPLIVGDLNCNGTIGFDDINPFVMALTNPAGWQAAYPGCNPLAGDINGSGAVDFGDINPFVTLLTGG
jgi:agmatine deiminase